MEQASLSFGERDVLDAWRAAFEDWVAARAQSSSTRRTERALADTSVAVYRDMWGSLAAFGQARDIALGELEPDDLELYLQTRAAATLPARLAARPGGAASSKRRTVSHIKGREVTERYAWRLLWLVDQVQQQVAARTTTPANDAAASLLRLGRYRFANAASNDPLPEYLQEAAARALIAFLTEARSADAPGGPLSWKALRDRTAVALMLGAGLTPGDVRGLTLAGVIVDGGKRAGIPWKLVLPPIGTFPEREAPLASWAGRQLAWWLQVRAEQGIAGELVFAATLSGKPWSHNRTHACCKAVLEAAGFSPDEAGGLYKLRHTYALRQLARGKSDADVARWLGLADQTAIARYRRIVPWQVDVA